MKLFSWSKILFICCLLAGGAIVRGQTNISSRALDELFSQDLKALHRVYKTEGKDQQMAIENALYGSLINLDALTYEQLKSGADDSSDGFNQIIRRHLTSKENEIIEEISDYSVEELVDYVERYPGRSDLVDLFLVAVVKPSADSISYVELSYLDRLLPALELQDKVSSRSGERAEMVRDNVRSYCEYEKGNTQVLIDLLNMTCDRYVVVNYRQVANAYSRIGIVPDKASDIDKQFRMIVNECLKSKDLSAQLKKIVNRYCASINAARAEFAKEANIKGYPLMSIEVPPIKGFSYSLGNGLLSKVPAARKDFVDSRETAGTVASIANWIVGPWVSNIGKGLYDMYAVGELADNEIGARKEIVSTAYDQIKYNLSTYTNDLVHNVMSQINANQKKFIDYVSKK